MQKNIWNSRLNWIKSGSTSPFFYYQQNHTELYNENKFIAVGDIYFRLNKYLTGVTFIYVINLNDIYNMNNLMTGDGYSLINMYNEYDVIDTTMKNLIIVDIAADTNIDLNKQWFEINGVKIKPGHLILLKNQDKLEENDIYIFDNQYFLNNSGFLSTRDKSEKFSCGVKLGKNADKQFFLVNSGNTFPVSFEPKMFIEGKSYLVKNLIKYNLYSNESKIIFTDYDLARKQVSENSNRYYDFVITGITLSSNPDIYATISYHHNSYSIRSGTTFSESYTGLTSTINNINSGYTYIPYPSDFDARIGDYIYLDMYSGNTIHLQLNSYIKNIENNYIVLEDIIPNYILTDLTDLKFYLENNNIATSWTGATLKMEVTPYSDYFDIYDDIISGDTYIYVSPKDYIYNKYFNYNELEFYFNDSNIYKYFYTTVQYLKYNLYDRLSIINSGFTSGFTFFNDYLISGNTFNSYLYTDNSRIKITTTLTGLTSLFKPYTYVYISGDSVTTEKTLIYSVNDYELIVEKPRNWTIIYPTQSQLPIVTSIQNIDGLKNISDILYEVYINEEYDWYIKRTDNERKYISKSYADILQKDNFFISNVTGILYENENNEFILKLFDLINDINLKQFEPIELIYVGVDKKTRLPIPISQITTTTTTTLVPTTTTTTTLVPITTTTTTSAPTTTTTTTSAPTTTTTTTSAPTTTTTTTSAPTTTTTTTSAPTTTTTTTSAPTTTTTTTSAPTTTTTTVPPTTTTTTTYLNIIYYGNSSGYTLSENDILTTFNITNGPVGTLSGRNYTFSSTPNTYKFWCIPDVPSGMSYGDRIIDKIMNDDNTGTVLTYSPYYSNIQNNPLTTGVQDVYYGTMYINGNLYRIYKTISNSSSRINYIVYSFY